MATKILATMQTNCRAIWPAFIAQNTFKNNSALIVSFLFGQKFFLSITDALSCINVQCFCMVCCVIVKLISYLFTGSPNACANYIEYISFVLILHIIYTKYIFV